MSRYVRKSAENQATEVAHAVSNIGTKRNEDKTARGTSVGSVETYKPTWKDLASFVQEVHKSGNAGKDFPSGLREVDVKTAGYYLAERAEQRTDENGNKITQGTLDKDRQAIEVMIRHYGNGDEKVGHVSAETPRGELATGSRYYSKDQINDLSERQGPKNALSTRLAAETGMRAHELANIRPYKGAEKAGEISERKYSENRFVGAEDRTERYVVTGKGGLVYEVRLTKETARLLEETKREHAVKVVDRKIEYWSRYDIGYGKAWSQSFTAASKKALNWSRGAHGTRHGYCQDRIEVLQRTGLSRDEALHAVSNEVGHLSPQTTEKYLR